MASFDPRMRIPESGCQRNSAPDASRRRDGAVNHQDDGAGTLDRWAGTLDDGAGTLDGYAGTLDVDPGS
jgi:hypothetical protein